METRLSREDDILQVSANILTGNVLVAFDSNNNHHTVEFLLEDILKEVWENGYRPHRGDSVPAVGPGEAVVPAQRRQRIPIETLKRFITPADQPVARPWHVLDAETAARLFRSDLQGGLTEHEAAKRLEQFGPNTLAEAEPRSGWSIFLDQLNSLPVYLLGAAAGVSVLTGGLLDAVVIMGVVVANCIIGVRTEVQAERTIDSLKHLVRPTAEVIREGRRYEIPAKDVVAGDLLVLKPGAYVAADSRIIEASRLSLDESMLTGESMPVFKHGSARLQDNTPLADRVNMVYMGTLVTGGQGLAVVVATGQATETGQLQILLQGTETPKTPIERQLAQMGDQLVLMCLGICGAVFVLGFVRGYGLVQMLRMAITLAASAVPEGLPAAATINFALGITRMRQHGVLIRRLQAVETLGAVQTVCLDKTGTITQNRMSVMRLFCGCKSFDVREDQIQTLKDGVVPAEVRSLLTVCALCHEIRITGRLENGDLELVGSSTEKALVRLAIGSGIDICQLQDAYRIVRLRHRAEDRHFMSTTHVEVSSGRSLFAMKGSPLAILAMCDRQMADGEVVPLTDDARQEIELENERLSGDALRVLGFAFRRSENGKPFDEESGLIWVGLAGMTDPVREGVQELIQVFHRAGVRTVMITGDQSATAYAVAREVGLSERPPLEILDSTQLETLEAQTLQALAKKVHVYSRVSPAHKLSIVQALQRAGLTVAMTGDGINDGPALKASNIGIAMGESGTDVAREVADVVLEGDDLELLILALRDGRMTYSNIRKAVHFFLSTNLSEIMVVFVSMAAGLGLPLSVMQLLWINIISDIFPGLALSQEEPEPDLMEKLPRDAAQPLFSGADFRKMALESALISAGSMAAYTYGISRYGLGARAGSLAFQSLTIGQLLHAYSCRSEDKSVFSRRPSNRALNLAVGGSLGLQLLTMVVPGLRNFLGLGPFSMLDAAVAGVTAFLPLVANETIKGLRVKTQSA